MSTATTEATITKISIQFSSANDGGWGPETTNEEAALVAANCAALAAAYAAKHWPGAEVEFGVTSWPDTSQGNWSEDADGDFYRYDEGPSESISNYMSNQWTEEALWSAEFDAEAYLEANPR